jgi:hypothetical protein
VTSAPAKSVRPGVARSPKPGKLAEAAVTLRGTVTKSLDDRGRADFSMTSAGKTWSLSAGPPWYWGDKNPLLKFVGKTVTVVGTARAGGSEIDVETVDGAPVRAPGKPPWAGGPRVVGKTHPGWHDWMAGGKPGTGRDDAPGQEKKLPATP